MKEHPVLLGELLRRQGEDALYMATASGGHAFRAALLSCGQCASFDRCRAFLASGAREGYDAFCPCAAFVNEAKALAS